MSHNENFILYRKPHYHQHADTAAWHSKLKHLYFVQKVYSHLFDKRGGWNKRGGGAKVAKSLNMEVGINVEGGIFWKKLVHNSNK